MVGISFEGSARGGRPVAHPAARADLAATCEPVRVILGEAEPADPVSDLKEGAVRELRAGAPRGEAVVH